MSDGRGRNGCTPLPRAEVWDPGSSKPQTCQQESLELTDRAKISKCTLNFLSVRQRQHVMHVQRQRLCKLMRSGYAMDPLQYQQAS